MRITDRCFAVTGLGYVPPWSVNGGFVVGDESTLIVDTGANALAAKTIHGYAQAVRPQMATLNTHSAKLPSVKPATNLYLPRASSRHSSDTAGRAKDGSLLVARKPKAKVTLSSQRSLPTSIRKLASSRKRFSAPFSQ